MTPTFYAGFIEKRSVQTLNPGQYSLAVREGFFHVSTWHQEDYYQFSFFYDLVQCQWIMVHNILDQKTQLHHTDILNC